MVDRYGGNPNPVVMSSRCKVTVFVPVQLYWCVCHDSSLQPDGGARDSGYELR
jgi:hypothetical protein